MDFLKNSQTAEDQHEYNKLKLTMAEKPQLMITDAPANLADPDDFPFFIICILKSHFHRVKQWIVPSILGFHRHFGDIYDLLFDQILLVDEA